MAYRFYDLAHGQQVCSTPWLDELTVRLDRKEQYLRFSRG